MSNTQQHLFKTIVLHNKLMPEADIDALLRQTPDPEQTILAMVTNKIITQQVSVQLTALYHKTLEHAAHGHPVPHAPSTATHPTEHHAGPAQPPVAHLPSSAVSSKGSPASVSVGDSPIDVTKGGKELLHQLLREARKVHASDLHVKSTAAPVVRVASILHDLDLPPISPEVARESLLSILNEQQKKRFFETNDIDFCYDAGPELGRFRTNYLFQHHGTDGIFRIINSRVPTFEELKLPEQIRRFCDYRQGIVLVTGPKASGKTTTLAALIDMINTKRAEHIITIEDPIEFVHPCKRCHVNQREVGPHTHSFSNALRATMRQAPDVIMVGEMRDLETTSLAITAAAMGTLVYATLHTPDAVRTIGRVLDVFPPAEQKQVRAMFAESLRGIVSQLLIPSVDGKSMELAVEVLFNTPAIGNMIHEAKAFQLHSVMQTGKRLGMMILDESVAQLAKEHRISKEDALARANNIAAMEKELAGIS